MAQYKLCTEAAVALLAQRSQQRNTELRDVPARIVADHDTTTKRAASRW
jgi:hypothetical protein